ncbi:MAG: acyl-CoA thioesterase, partial [Aquificae bacterium]|nr:acyl-CoA thioesterase [Aquificota bacterium]
KRRIQFYETDAQGFMHHSNYFRLFEETRGEFLRSLGLPYSEFRRRGFEVVLIDAYAKYLRPVFYDDLVEVSLNLEDLSRLKFAFGYTVSVNGELKAKGKTTHCVIKNGKPVKLPKELYEKLSSFVGKG